MRFVVGLCFGALFVLIFAALFNWPAQRLSAAPATAPSAQSDSIANWIDGDLDEVLRTDIELAEAEPTASVASTEVGTTSSGAGESEPATPPTVSEPGPVTAKATAAAITQASPAAEDAPPAVVETATETPSPWAMSSADLMTPADAAEDEGLKFDEPAAAADIPEDSMLSEANPQVAVWRPFHSQVSAAGFAKRLSLQLGYPFSVVKVAPARYHVVFSYDDIAQKELLAEQLTALTGYTPQ